MNAVLCRNCGKCKNCVRSSLYGSSYTARLPSKKIPKKIKNIENGIKKELNSESDVKKKNAKDKNVKETTVNGRENKPQNGQNKTQKTNKAANVPEAINAPDANLVQGWMCKTLQADGKPCKKTYFDKARIVEHIEAVHQDSVGKICKVLIKRPPTQKPPTPKVEPKKKEPKDVFRCTYCQHKDNSIDKLHDHITSMHDTLWLAQMAKKRKVEGDHPKFKCSLCPMKTESFQILKDHIDQHDTHQQCRTATRIQSANGSKPEIPCSTQPKTNQAFFSCYFCSTDPFVNVELLYSHLRVDHSITANNLREIFATCHSNLNIGFS